MADLENLLLEAAGRTGTSARNRQSLASSGRRRRGPQNDDDSDSNDDDLNEEHGYASRKPSGTQIPLKKRLDPSDRDEDQDSPEGENGDGSCGHGDGSDDSDIGSDLYKDEEDRQQLAQLTELQREMILSERATKKGDKGLKEKLRLKCGFDGKHQYGKEDPPVSSSHGVRVPARNADREVAKDDALTRAKRLKNQDPETQRKLKDASRGGLNSRDFAPAKRKPFNTASPSSSSESDSDSDSHSEDQGSIGDGGLEDSDEEKKLETGVPSFEDIKEITLKRSKLGKWLMEPFFDELVVGCFVRVGIGKSRSGPIYRLCIIQNIDSSDPDRQYKLENKTTSKYLNCVWGNENSAARWQMAMVSDSPPLEEEYKQWVREVERSGGRMPSKEDVLEKKEAIKKSNTFIYSAETVKQMLQEKKSASSRPLNVAAEKERLRRELAAAMSKNNEPEVERIKGRLKQLEASQQPQAKNAKAIMLAEMNRKNRAENFKNASELKPVNAGLRPGEAGHDPFSRRWTRSRNYYVSKPAGGDVAADAAAVSTGVDSNENGATTYTETGFSATAAALEAAADAGKLLDTSAPVDRGTESNKLHDFELPVSLAGLQKFGGSQGAVAGFLARKQRIEATVGCRVPENDGKRHALTLTVSDYKRRRGLL